MRRLVGTIGLIALLASPTVARTRFFCRFSGVEISGCDEQRVPDHAAVQAEDCCERRVAAPLSPARIAAADGSSLAPMQASRTVEPVWRTGWSSSRRPEPADAASSGPPLFLAQGALLI